jgi:multidrug resistance efflux pump
MSEFHPTKVRPRARLTSRRLLSYWPLLVFLGIVAITAWTYVKGVEFNRVNGVVDVIQEAVAADEDGRITRILVQTGQLVTKGEAIVKLDTAVFDQQIARLTTAIASDLADKVIAYQNDLSRLKRDLRDLERDKAADEAELHGIDALASQINSAMAKPEAAAARPMLMQALAKLENDRSRLKATTFLYPTQVEEVKKDKKRLEDEIEKLSKITDAEEQARANGDLARLEELKVLRDRATIKSSHTGVVDRIDKDEGEFVAQGTPIVRIVAFPEMIRAFLPEDQINQIQKDSRVWVSPQTDRTKAFETRVRAISPRVNAVPDTSSPLPNMILHGQEVVINYPKDSGLAPGQRVIVHLKEPGRVELFAKLFSWGS